MSPTTVAELKLYAEVHFHDDFARLPDVKLEILEECLSYAELCLVDQFYFTVFSNRVH